MNNVMIADELNFIDVQTHTCTSTSENAVIAYCVSFCETPVTQ